jgi:alkylation response protein AidB-like acyl-CoA dehydrogenase
MNAQTDLLSNFRLSCRDFLAKETMPYQASWELQGYVDRSFWLKAGQAGLLGIGVTPEYGGMGQSDFRFAMTLIEELLRAGMSVPGMVSHNDVIASYILTQGNEEQRRRWLPGLCSGQLIGAIAITESHAGSDVNDLATSATRQNKFYLLNGSKAYITNGHNADIVVVAVKTQDSQRGHGISLLVVERDTQGFSRGPLRAKLGWHASDTTDLYFDHCLVPQANLLGRENLGSFYFMSAMIRERLSISTVAVASAEIAMEETLAYVKDRKVFGQAIGSFQYNRFMLAQLDTEVKIARLYLNNTIERFNTGALGIVDVARLKLWVTELQNKVADRCLQLHGASGYMGDSSIGKNWANSRVQRIYGGTSEVLQELISKSLGL